MRIEAPSAMPLRPPEPAGATVVLVHGLEDDPRTWRPLAQALPSAWNPVALELPWRAGNDYLWRAAGTPGDWLAAGLAALPSPPALVVGHSFGATSLLNLAADGGVTGPIVLITPFYRQLNSAPTWDGFERIRRAFEQQIRQGVRFRLGRRTERLPAEVVEGIEAKAWERIGPLGFVAVYEQYVKSSQLTLSDVECPVLIVTGDESGEAEYQPVLDKLAAALPRGQIRHLQDYHHFGHLAKAADVAATVDEFGRSSRAPR